MIGFSLFLVFTSSYDILKNIFLTESSNNQSVTIEYHLFTEKCWNFVRNKRFEVVSWIFFWIFKRRLKNIAISLMLFLFTHSSRLKNIWEHLTMFSNCSLNEYKFSMFNEHCQCSWMFLMFQFEEHGGTLTEHRKMLNQMFIMYFFVQKD